jgi:hypothetical protein
MDTINMDSFLPILLSTRAPVNVDPTVEAWLFELNHRKSFHVAITDLSDPYNKVMSTSQAFANSIIDGLERNDAEVVSLIDGDILKTLYSGHPTFEYVSFKWWVKDSILKHPHRRWPKQAEFIKILQLQGANIILCTEMYRPQFPCQRSWTAWLRIGQARNFMAYAQSSTGLCGKRREVIRHRWRG